MDEKRKVPIDVYAMFGDDASVHLRYERAWRQCFSTPRHYDESGKKAVFHESPFLHHITTDGINSPWADMTRRDWADVCFAYRMQLEVDA